jgi:hypothetical protein
MYIIRNGERKRQKTDKLTKWKTDRKTKTQRCGQRDKKKYVHYQERRTKETNRETDRLTGMETEQQMELFKQDRQKNKQTVTDLR